MMWRVGGRIARGNGLSAAGARDGCGVRQRRAPRAAGGLARRALGAGRRGPGGDGSARRPSLCRARGSPAGARACRRGNQPALWISNVVKCRPTREEGGRVANRPPTTREVRAWLSLLEEEIEILRPGVILCLGGIAAKALIRPDFAMTPERGAWTEFPPSLASPGCVEFPPPTTRPISSASTAPEKKPRWNSPAATSERHWSGQGDPTHRRDAEDAEGARRRALITETRRKQEATRAGPTHFSLLLPFSVSPCLRGPQPSLRRPPRSSASLWTVPLSSQRNEAGDEDEGAEEQAGEAGEALAVADPPAARRRFGGRPALPAPRELPAGPPAPSALGRCPRAAGGPPERTTATASNSRNRATRSSAAARVRQRCHERRRVLHDLRALARAPPGDLLQQRHHARPMGPGSSR